MPQLINNDDVALLGRTATEELMKKRALLTEWKEREEAIAKSDEAEKEKEDKRRARESWLPSNNPSSATSTTTSTAEGGNGPHHIQQLERVAL